MKASLQRNTWLVLVFGILLTGCQSHPALTDTSSVERDVRAHLPIGSPRAKVVAYLDNRKIQHSWLELGNSFVGPSVVDSETGLPKPADPTIRAVIDCEQTNFWVVQSGIAIDFKFDATKTRLVAFKVFELLTGP